MEEPENKTGKALWIAALKDKYPDLPEEYDGNEDTYHDASTNGYNDRVGKYKELLGNNEKWMEVLLEDPEIFDKVMAALDENSDLQKTLKDRRDTQEATRIAEEGYAQKWNDSEPVIAAWKEKRQMADEDFDKFFEENYINKMIKHPRENGISEELLDELERLANYKKDMAEAEEAARVKALNEKVVANRKQAQGDNLPEAKGGGTISTEKKKIILSD